MIINLEYVKILEILDFVVLEIIVFLFMDLCAYVVRYRKKPKTPKAKKTIAAPAPAPAENAGEGGGDDGAGDGE